MNTSDRNQLADGQPTPSLFVLISALSVVFFLVSTSHPVAASSTVANASISGAVWYDVNGNGIWEPNEEPRADHPVYLQRLEDPAGAATATVQTDEEGMFLFANLEYGDYEISTENGGVQIVTLSGVKAPVSLDLPYTGNRLFLPFAVR